jgi:Second Messenger Oligonucleotide or Dinucleotide Synthetase domain
MTLSVAQGFETFLGRLVPLESQRAAAARHRASVEASLRGGLEVYLFRETGSFSHGTGVRGHCDVDLLVSIKGQRPGSSDTALAWVKNALAASFPYTRVRISRPAVVIAFAGGEETWEVIPGFVTGRGGEGVSVYDIPGAATGWLDTAPLEHLAYVTEVNSRPDIAGGAKKLARLIKAWKYYNAVPVSSFYLEMRAAQYLVGQPSFVPVYDICYLLEHLNRIALAAMNDPKGAAGRFEACSTTAKKAEALSKLSTGATRARKALDAHRKDESATAFYYLDLLFGGQFPSR